MSFYVFFRNGDDHGNGYDHDSCRSTTAWRRPRLLPLSGGLMSYDHGNGYDRSNG